MKRVVLIAILFFPPLLLAAWVLFGANLMRNMASDPNRKSIAERLLEYGPASRARLKPLFETAKIAYPPARLALVGLKSEKQLQVYASAENQPFAFITSIPILAASGKPGPKLREGDEQVPEGIYPIELLNPNSKFHLALRLGYPNQFDREQARKEGRENLGGDIMIHGGAASVGCLAIGDQAIEDLFVLAADTGFDRITVILSPVDFRNPDAKVETNSLPAWSGELYAGIKSKLRELPVPANPAKSP